MKKYKNKDRGRYFIKRILLVLADFLCLQFSISCTQYSYRTWPEEINIEEYSKNVSLFSLRKIHVVRSLTLSVNLLFFQPPASISM